MPNLAPLLVLLATAVPDSSQQALAQLQSYGELPSCGSSKPRPELKGHTPKVTPYLEHWSELVVRRAVSILCHVPDDEARAALIALNGRYPCRRWLEEAMTRNVTSEQEIYARMCRTAEPEAGAELNAKPPELASGRTAASDALAARLTQGEDAAYAEAFRALEAIDHSRAREAAVALASVDTLEGWKQLRRRCAQWEETKGRKNVFPQERGCGLGVALASLEAAARRAERPSDELFMEAVRSIEPEEAYAYYFLARITPPLWDKVVPRVAQARPEAVKNKGLRAFIAVVDNDVASSQPGEYQKEAARLEAYKKAKDHKALLAYARTPGPMYLLRLLAAYHLADLGDGSALDLFEDSSYFSSDEHLVKTSLEELLPRTQGKVRERVKALLRRYEDARHPAEGLELDARKKRRR